MRRLFIIRKDLNMKPGKLAAMTGHCCEAFWTNLLKRDYQFHKEQHNPILEPTDKNIVSFQITLPKDIWNKYVNGAFTKTICECKNLNDLRKIDKLIAEINSDSPEDDQIIEGKDFGYINDKCLTDLTPENPDGTCTVGVWFRPLPDEIAHKISRKYKLYGAFDK